MSGAVEHDEVERELLAWLAAELGAVPVPETSLRELGLDELERARLLHAFEARFARPVPDALLTAETRVGELVAHLQRVTHWEYPRPPSGSGADLARADFGFRLLRPALQAALRPLLRLLWRLRVEGRQHVPRAGPFVLVANHGSHLDTPSLMAALPLARVNDAHPLAAHDYFFRSALLGESVHLLFNAIPLDRKASAESAMKAGLDLLAEGHGVVLFPEGTRGEGELQPFKKGVGLLLAGKPYPALPARITGAREALPRGRAWPRFGAVSVRIGTPVSYASAADTREGWKAVAADLEARVRALG